MTVETRLAPVQPDAESARTLALARRMNSLHQLLYARGGVKPVNSAIEELAKLLFLKIAAQEQPDMPVGRFGRLEHVLDISTVLASGSTDGLKAAFRSALALDTMRARLPNGESQSIWPLDEPFRLLRSDIAAEALEIVSEAVSADGHGALDVLGLAFDVFLQGRYDHAGGLGTYLTPHEITSAMARLALQLVDPLVGRADRVVFGDPCCGTGRFLISLIEELADRDASAATLRRFMERGVLAPISQFRLLQWPD